MPSGSRATSPVNSNHSGDTQINEVSDSEDDVNEAPAESAEAELSM